VPPTFLKLSSVGEAIGGPGSVGPMHLAAATCVMSPASMPACFDTATEQLLMRSSSTSLGCFDGGLHGVGPGVQVLQSGLMTSATISSK
jgi:hypothetical protein